MNTEARKTTDRLTVPQACAESGYSVRYVRQLCREDNLESVKVGNAYLIRPESLRGCVAEMQRPDPRKHARD